MAAISDGVNEEIRSGRTTQERKIAICAGAASFPPEERIEILAILAADSDEIVRQQAAGALLTQTLPNVIAALARTDAAPEMFAYCAAEFPRRPGVADALAKNPTCPIAVLRPVVRYLSVSAVQELFEDLDRLSTSPELVASLVESSVVTAEQRGQLVELQREEPEGIEAFVEAVEAAEPDAAKRETLLQKISRLSVVERVQLAMKGESFAAMTSLNDETLRLIASNRKFRKNYAVTRALINNPKTPLEISLHLLPAITPQDLKLLTTNKNVPDTLRTSAARLKHQRYEKQQGT